MSAEKKHDEDAVTRIYEAGYVIAGSVKEEDVEKVVSGIRGEIEKLGGSFIAEGAPGIMKLAYPMEQRVGEKLVTHDRGYFGWLKFEAETHAAAALTKVLTAHPSIFRSIVFKTVREDTRAKYKAPTLREVKRTDTIPMRARPVAEKEEARPVSEADLEKALETLTAE